MKVTVVGMGYVGLSIATLLSQKNDVVAVDIIPEKIKMINNRISPIKDKEIEFFFREKQLNLRATLDLNKAIENSEFIVISTPTNYDEETRSFDTTSVEKIIQKIVNINKDALIVIKSTIPVGFTEKISKVYNTNNVIFSPEFLREGKALYDNLYPSRIIIGGNNKKSAIFAQMLEEMSFKKQVKKIFMSSSEAEAVKLFSNTYLALRVAFFNELDTYAVEKKLDSKNIIEGISLDKRIGNHYNNPSFGYGGYCLPKDTKQLLANYNDIPQNLIKAVIESNDTRKKFIANKIINMNPKVVGIYRLTMKKNSDNFRMSAMIDIIKILKKNNIELVIYEPSYNGIYYEDCKVEKNFDVFTQKVDVILANRVDKCISKFKNVYTRDIFNIN